MPSSKSYFFYFLRSRIEVDIFGYSTAALKYLKNLAAVVGPASNTAGAPPNGKTAPTAAKPSKVQIPDCCICMYPFSIPFLY
jgi:hypothetical protein